MGCPEQDESTSLSVQLSSLLEAGSQGGAMSGQLQQQPSVPLRPLNPPAPGASLPCLAHRSSERRPGRSSLSSRPLWDKERRLVTQERPQEGRREVCG